MLLLRFVVLIPAVIAHKESQSIHDRSIAPDEVPASTLTWQTANDWLQKAHPSEQPPSDDYLKQNAETALQAYKTIPVAASVPQDLFLNFVLPYRHLDEPIDNWRPSFFKVLAPFVANAKTLREATELIVPRAWDSLRSSSEVMQVPNATPVVFKSNCTPAIMAPLSETLTQGHASCTGCSILAANALRAVGIPARVVGTPEWNIPTGGNHNWVEVWTGEGKDGWQFFDAAPGATVELNKGWFYPGQTKLAKKGTIWGIYTPLWNAELADGTFNATWRTPALLLPAEDRTEFYSAPVDTDEPLGFLRSLWRKLFG